MELSTCRQIGYGGSGPIPLTAIQDYADRYQLGDLFIRQVLAIDRQVLAEMNSDNQADNKRGQSHG